MKAALLALLSLAAIPAAAAELQITVTNIRSDKGDILVAVCSKAEFLKPSCAYHGKTPAKTGNVTLVIGAIPPGTWAVQAFHDQNGNGTLDRTFLGLPEEGMGFSRDAPMRFGPPVWDDAAFTLLPAGGAVSFTLRYND